MKALIVKQYKKVTVGQIYDIIEHGHLIMIEGFAVQAVLLQALDRRVLVPTECVEFI